MLGQPVARIAETIGMLRQIDAVAQREAVPVVTTERSRTESGVMKPKLVALRQRSNHRRACHPTRRGQTLVGKQTTY
jgi:hypothetical protein